MRKIRVFGHSHFEVFLIILIFIGILAIALLIHYKFAFLNFFFLPVILSGYFLGKRKAILTGVFCFVLVILYQFFLHIFKGLRWQPSLDELINIISWGCFLVLTGMIIGIFSEQRESRLEKMRMSYLGVLKIMLKYLEVADEKKPRSLRVSHLAGEIARALALDTNEVENIKSAALLYEAGDLQSSLPFFEELADFMKSDMKVSEAQTVDKEQLILSTTASLLREIEPLLSSYFRHYVKEANILNKDLNEIPVGSSIIAIADLYDRISTHPPHHLGGKEIKSLEDIEEKLLGKTFSASVVRALQEVIPTL